MESFRLKEREILNLANSYISVPKRSGRHENSHVINDRFPRKKLLSLFQFASDKNWICQKSRLHQPKRTFSTVYESSWHPNLPRAKAAHFKNRIRIQQLLHVNLTLKKVTCPCLNATTCAKLRYTHTHKESRSRYKNNWPHQTHIRTLNPDFNE